LNFKQLINRKMNSSQEEEHGNLPWDDPDFSSRMLKEHLSQRYDAASRRTSLIRKHVDWIHRFILKEKYSKILDLGCGPGLYTSRLAEIGHQCEGIDFSPAAIEYAKRNAAQKKLNCEYRLKNIFSADYGNGFDLVMLVFSEFNTFSNEDAQILLVKSHQSLKSGGKILLEVPSFDAVEQLGNQPSVWYTEKKGIFSEEPYLCLTESFWNEEKSIATEKYFIIEESGSDIRVFNNKTHAYEDKQFKQMITTAGFKSIEFHPSLTGSDEQQLDGMFVILAKK
jgi:SAM-dependent methyltransferase